MSNEPRDNLDLEESFSVLSSFFRSSNDDDRWKVIKVADITKNKGGDSHRERAKTDTRTEKRMKGITKEAPISRNGQILGQNMCHIY